MDRSEPESRFDVFAGKELNPARSEPLYRIRFTKYNTSDKITLNRIEVISGK